MEIQGIQIIQNNFEKKLEYSLSLFQNHYISVVTLKYC